MATETSSCDYLVVGAGASGMSFVDTLLLHAPEPVSVTLLDKREQPGGHWNDAYDYVTLHQPARNYGVESTALEAFTQHPEKLASRDEILDYYRSLLSRWGEAGHRVSFVGGATYDFGSASYVDASGSRVGVDASKVVDARYTENDLPLLVPPKFSVGDGVDLIPPNQLPARGAGEGRRYCVLGGGEAGGHARSELALPGANEGGRSAAELTTYVHCTAGAFNFGASAAEGRRPVFSSEGEITVQELFQFPGFCFNGAVVAWLECQRGLSLAQKNALCELPPPPEEGEAPPLGQAPARTRPRCAHGARAPIGHPLLVSLRNLRRWYATPGMGEWLHGLRLFSLAMNGYSLAEGRALVEKNCDGLVEAGLLTPPEEGR
ncbi:hypothetical protein EMIHUDRAFT_459670 [Emiliania huxleyi CCMP1516]|uniref:Uncharacterized protein n=2 Tax=Emiliania huxleyi TaxID=2903 RepID=A0A0D3IMN7_EMIH1|nr:hypothetical protein EMIHUDRAFT_459670 [Emiliania huxleyi CCMP1516]EOD12522.1 hypothetical protein EMIHUDRAFT_459670 [Emiliania huxleyi CCMP1516]|eukprot:XP_005764951.1 hypothetical protein EMIHUDRAFT_459670 [Emiliania huxleyi CCMP1516]